MKSDIGERSEANRGNGGNSVEVIMHHATKLFGEVGYPGTTMRDIAAGVGILPGSLYAHIESKESLLLSIVTRGIDDFVRAGESVSATLAPGERLRQFVKAHVAVVAESPSRTLVVFHQWRYLSPANQEVVKEKRERYEDMVTSIIVDGMRTGVFDSGLNARVAVLSVLGSLNWTAEWLQERSDLGAIGDELADVMLTGLLTSTSPTMTPSTFRPSGRDRGRE